MELLESMFYEYYVHSHVILGICAVVFVIGILFLIFCQKENRRYILNRSFHMLFYICAVIFAGILCAVLKLCPEIAYIHFNVLVFTLSVTGIAGYCLFEGVFFRKVRIPLLQFCKVMKGLTLGELFLLKSTCHLDWQEGITATLLIGCLEMIQIVVERVKVRNKQKPSNELDYPNPNLFETRKRQLDQFLSVLEQQTEEPYAIMIAGAWGAGKSSFVRALEESLPQDVFIWIRAGAEKSVSEIMMEISEQILSVLKENNVLIEKEGVIEKYFMTFSDLMDEIGITPIWRLVGLLDNNTKADRRVYLNGKLDDLNKTIYLVVDDLDRCEKEYQEKMFKVIRESTDLRHCKTMFLVDKTQFQVGDKHYIEKYISYTLELCEVSCEEIINCVFDDIMDASFLQNMNGVLMKGRDTVTVKNMICRFPEQILLICQTEISKLSDSLSNPKQVSDRKKKEDKIAELNDTVLTIKRNTGNARKMKNYLKGFKRDIAYLNEGIGLCSEEFRAEDWLGAMIEVQFLKNFLPSLYADMRMCSDIYEFEEKYKGCSVNLILGIKSEFWSNKENKKKLLNDLIYRVDVIDYEQVQSVREKILRELHHEPTLDHIMDYLKYAHSYNDFSKIIELSADQEFHQSKRREEFLEQILGMMGKLSYITEMNDAQMAALTKQLLEAMKGWNISEKEKKYLFE